MIRRGIVSSIGIGLLLVLAAAVRAGDGGAPAHARREVAQQVVTCMKRRMAADRYLSYNQAARDCRAAVLKGGGGEALMAETRPAH